MHSEQMKTPEPAISLIPFPENLPQKEQRGLWRFTSWSLAFRRKIISFQLDFLF